jgi:hypothetical protein
VVYLTDKSETSKAVLEEAYRRGKDYLTRFACAPGVFAAVMDTLGYDKDPAVMEVFKATVGLIGGTGNMAIGTCGAMAGAAMAISYSFGFTKASFKTREDMAKIMKAASVVAEVGKQMQEKYGHIQCQEVQFHLWGKSYRFTNPEAMQESMEVLSSDPRCNDVSGDVARWTVEKILAHNPQFSKRK